MFIQPGGVALKGSTLKTKLFKEVILVVNELVRLNIVRWLININESRPILIKARHNDEKEELYLTNKGLERRWVETHFILMGRQAVTDCENPPTVHKELVRTEDLPDVAIKFALCSGELKSKIRDLLADGGKVRRSHIE